ncbi:MAG: porin [Mariniphaga sp.]
MKTTITVFILTVLGFSAYSQTTNDVLDLLIKNKLITQGDADSIRAEAAIKQQDFDAGKKSFFVSAGRLIQLSGYSQIRYQFLQEAGKADGFDIRRARLDIKGSLSPYFSYRLQTDFAGTPKIMDAYGEIKIFDYLNFTIGQAKIPFSFENLASSNKMESIDRSQVVEALVTRGKDVIGNHNGRDIGVQVGGSLVKIKNRFLFDYKVGVFNGSGINQTDKNKNKDIVWRFISHPVKGLDFGGSVYIGTGNFGTPTTTNQVRNRSGVEVNYEYQRFFIRGEFIEGKDGVISRNGWYAHTGYFIIPARLQFILKYDIYDPNSAISGNISTAYLIGGTYHFNNWSKIQAGFTLREVL